MAYKVGDIVRIKTLEEIKRQYSYYLPAHSRKAFLDDRQR
jgi:hypothetical protein